MVYINAYYDHNIDYWVKNLQLGFSRVCCDLPYSALVQR